MKKFIALILAMLMVLSMAACGAKTETPAAADTKTETPSTNAGTTGTTDTTDTTDTTEEQTDAAPAYTLVNPGKLTVAISPDFAPMEFVDTEGNFAGFDVMLAQYIADSLGLELQINPMSFDACQTAVAMGAVDMAISGFSWTEAREANYNLSDYYHAGDNEDEQILITLEGNEGKYTSAEALAGVKVGAQVASLQESLVMEQLPDSQLVTVGDLNTALMQMRNGDFDVLAVAKGNGDAMIANNPDVIPAGFNFVVDEKYTGNVIMLQKGADALTDAVNAILAQAEAEGNYVTWYEIAKNTAGIDVSYDDEGNAITE